MPAPKLVEGKYVLIVVLALGLAGAGGGWWYQQNLQRRPLELWGSDAARLILRAGDVELCRLEPATHDLDSASAIIVGRNSYQLAECTNAAAVRGFLHLRHSLLNDYSFDWNDAASGEHDWRYAIRFHNGEKTATLVISGDFSYAMLLETGSTACIRPIALGMEQVLGEAWVKER